MKGRVDAERGISISFKDIHFRPLMPLIIKEDSVKSQKQAWETGGETNKKEATGRTWTRATCLHERDLTLGHLRPRGTSIASIKENPGSSFMPEYAEVLMGFKFL